MTARLEYLKPGALVYSFRGPRSHRRVYIDVPYSTYDPCSPWAPLIEGARKVILDAEQKVLLESRNNPKIQS